MIIPDKKTFEFIRNNMNQDVSKLLLKASKHPDFDIPFIADQIISLRNIKDKLPEWYQKEEITIPSRISSEQCSSELTAKYKQSLFDGGIICDLTGGLGVDSYYFAQKSEKSFYIERFEEYCLAARHNFKTLGADNIEVINADSREAISMLPEHLDCFYIDPARRSDSNKRIFAIDECEPDILLMKDQLFSKAPRIIIKISTMADISHTISLLPELKTIHVVALKNECKEILLILERGFDNNGHNVEIICSNIKSEDQCDSFTYNKDEEENSQAQFTPEFKTFLYEPNSAILKAGAFKSIGNSFELSKVGPSSHLYTSGNLHEEFPGRIFTINEVIPFGSKTLKTLKNIYPKANITVRNFPLSVEDIRKRSGVKDGGDIYIFATTLGNNDKYLLVTSKIN